MHALWGHLLVLFTELWQENVASAAPGGNLHPSAIGSGAGPTLVLAVPSVGWRGVGRLTHS